MKRKVGLLAIAVMVALMASVQSAPAGVFVGAGFRIGPHPIRHALVYARPYPRWYPGYWGGYRPYGPYAWGPWYGWGPPHHWYHGHHHYVTRGRVGPVWGR